MLRLLKKQESCSLCKFEKYITSLKCASLNFNRQKSYYQVLGLNSSASPKDIKAAYYELCLQFHPDKNNGCPDAVAKFREITEAYEVLSNPEKKMNYDQDGTFKSHYSGPRDHYYKPYYSKHRQHSPYTGKTKDFDYDEHFRQHYEFEKKRQAEYEYFKQRWEAEFRRRSSANEEYFRNWHNYSKREDPRNEFAARYPSYRGWVFYYLAPMWFLFFIFIPLCSDLLDPEKVRYQPRIYYDINKENDETDDE